MSEHDRNAAPGWYPDGHGSQRWWDGSQWTGHVAPTRPLGPPRSSGSAKQEADASEASRVGPASWCGWSGLALTALVGVVSSGATGLLALSGLYVLVVAVVALVRGRVHWAGLRGRALAGVALGAALGLIVAGGAIAGPPTEAPLGAPSATPDPQEDPAAEPAPDVTPGTAPEQAREGTALAAVAALTVKGRAPRTGYTREAFGPSWFDADRNGCDTRNDMLRRDLVDTNLKNACKVLAGTLGPDPYTGSEIRFELGGASEVDIDHVVALSDAWQKGAGRWSAEKRLAFANDPLNLLAVDAGVNRAKGDGDTATWLPPHRPYRCAYVARQVAVKAKYDVWVTSPERDAMIRVLSGCAGTKALDPGAAPTEAALPRSRATARAPERPATKAPGSAYYESCTAVRAAGAAPIRAGRPGYSGTLDRDGDGVACE